MSTPLRFITYLTPSIPEAFYRALSERVAARLGVNSLLEVDTRRSSPERHADPFSDERADVGFMCAPGYQELRRGPKPPLELLVAPLHDDPRNQGAPVYFSEVVVAEDAPFADFADAFLRARWGYNDDGSLSGYHSILRRARALDLPLASFEDAVQTGSHLRSLSLLASGAIEAAAIDGNALAIRLRREPAALAGLRVLASLGPHPVQPVVVRASLPVELKAGLRQSFLALHEEQADAALLISYGVQRFVAVDEGDYPDDRDDDVRCPG